MLTDHGKKFIVIDVTVNEFERKEANAMTRLGKHQAVRTKSSQCIVSRMIDA